MENITLKAKDSYELNLHLFEIANPIGYVQIIHGMEEHQERYEPFAKVLNEAGYTVISSDMRGHGSNAPTLGYFADKKGYLYLLSDQVRITKFIKERYNTNQVILFAHSMGTIIARNLLQTKSLDYTKVILSGYPCPQAAASFGLLLTDFIRLFKGPKYHSKLVEDMAVGQFNKAIKNPKTDFDWLSFNEDNIKAYQADAFCGHGFSVSAFHDLFRLVHNMARVNDYTDVNEELPILMIRGKEDPCTGFDKGSEQSKKILFKAGFTNLTSIDYPSMRHEILNELGKDKVYRDILSFLGK